MPAVGGYPVARYVRKSVKRRRPAGKSYHGIGIIFRVLVFELCGIHRKAYGPLYPRLAYDQRMLSALIHGVSAGYTFAVKRRRPAEKCYPHRLKVHPAVGNAQCYRAV